MADVWSPKSPDDFAAAIEGELPQGGAWPRDPDGDLMRWTGGCAQVWGEVVEPAAAKLLTVESDPRQAVDLLPDWETAVGLPDACLSEPLTLSDRQAALVNRIRADGGQSRAFFIELAATIGYQIEIVEYSPFMGGVSQGGDTRPTGTDGEEYRWYGGPPEMRFQWKVKVKNARLTWFRGGQSEGGVDHHLTIGIASDLECLLRRCAPAHTVVFFDYSGVAANGAMAGLP